MKSRFSMMAALVAGAALALTACGSSDSSADKGAGGGTGEPYRVLVMGGLSADGVLKNNAQTSILSAKAGAENVNRNGGVLGHKVEITVVDDGANPTVAVTKLREALASKSRPDLVLNSGPSTIAAATLPILKQNNVLSFNIGPTEDSADPAAFPLNFDLSASPTDYAKGFVAYLQQKGYKSVGVIHGSSAYGVTFGQRIEKALTDAGITVVANEEYDVAALDMTPQLQAIQAKNPEALVMDGYGGPVGYLLKSLEKLGWDIPVVGNNSMAATGLISSKPPAGVLGTDQVKNLVMEVYISTRHDPADTRVNEAVKTMTALGEIPSTLINAYNYDALPLVAAAAEKAGTADDPKAIATALEDPAVQEKAVTAILPRYNFSAQSHEPNVGADAFTFIAPSELKNGQFQPGESGQ
ncbi:ABC transporter substrate-binding protein [Sphaerimonospora cavernae]|uniref:ABC transporter substrate-binding protein n=1 Tax=Sphaerimonospora cavernae TaxID=1740611 RepID=A0ABV6TYY6_9ACTN